MSFVRLTQLRRKLRAPRTLRFRLVAWNAAIIVLTASLTLIGLRAGVRLAILHEIDGVLVEDLLEIKYELTDAGATPDTVSETDSTASTTKVREVLASLQRKDHGHEQHGWFVRIFDDSGKKLWASEHAPDTLKGLIAAKDKEPTTVENYRFVQTRLEEAGRPPLNLQVGSLTTFVDRDMTRIDWAVAIAVGVVLIAGPGIGYWLAGRAIDPLANIIQTTARLRPSKMDERLLVQRTGDELDQLAQTINSFLNRIADYLGKRRDFLANAAHELRTPLAAIRSTAEVSLGAERSVEEYQELLVEVIEECSLLESLVNQLLLLAETESDRLRMTGERVDLSGVAAKAIGMFEAVAETKEVSLAARLQPELVVEGNAHHLRQVVNNLIDNALKFTPAGGKVSVRLWSDGAAAAFSVQDNGPGIPVEDLPHIFERFFRGDRSHSHDGERMGTGLGLSICQAVVQAHSGRLTVESQPQLGTTFLVTIPLAPEMRDAGSENFIGRSAFPVNKPVDSA